MLWASEQRVIITYGPVTRLKKKKNTELFLNIIFVVTFCFCRLSLLFGPSSEEYYIISLVI